MDKQAVLNCEGGFARLQHIRNRSYRNAGSSLRAFISIWVKDKPQSKRFCALIRIRKMTHSAMETGYHRRAQEIGSEKCVVGGNRGDRVAGGDRGEIGGDPSVSALRHTGSGFQGHCAINARPARRPYAATGTIQGLHNKGRCLTFGSASLMG